MLMSFEIGLAIVLSEKGLFIEKGKKLLGGSLTISVHDRVIFRGCQSFSPSTDAVV
jgi:hypothetical protein